MIFWITTSDGSINFKTDAASSDDAFENLAHKLEYIDYQSMCVDLGYTGASFSVSTIEEQLTSYDAVGDRLNVERQRDRTVLGAFKHLLRG